MTEPLDLSPELPSGRDAPAVIHLPSPPPVPEPYRPHSGSEKRQRRHVVQFRTDDAELAELQRRAWDSGRLSVGAFCRKRALGHPGVRHARGPAPLDVRLLARHLSEFNRIGNNLNQTTRALNELRLIAREIRADRLARIAAAAIERSETAIDELREAINAVCRALGYDRER
jgi:hypothetical protein